MQQTDWLTTRATHARSRAADAIARARRHADSTNRDWTDRAVDTLRAWAAGRGEFLAETFIAAGLAGFARAATSNGTFKPTWRAA